MRLPNVLMALTPVELEQLLAGAVKQASKAICPERRQRSRLQVYRDVLLLGSGSVTLGIFGERNGLRKRSSGFVAGSLETAGWISSELAVRPCATPSGCQPEPVCPTERPHAARGRESAANGDRGCAKRGERGRAEQVRRADTTDCRSRGASAVGPPYNSRGASRGLGCRSGTGNAARGRHVAAIPPDGTPPPLHEKARLRALWGIHLRYAAARCRRQVSLSRVFQGVLFRERRPSRAQRP